MACAYERKREIRLLLSRHQRLTVVQLSKQLTDFYADTASGKKMLRRDLQDLCDVGEVQQSKIDGVRELHYGLAEQVREQISILQELEVIEMHLDRKRPTHGWRSPLELADRLHELLNELDDRQRFRVDLQPSDDEGLLREFNPDFLIAVFEALAWDRALQLKYRNRAGEASTPLLHVQCLQLKGNTLRLVAVRDQDLHQAAFLRTYTLENVVDMKVADVECVHRPDLTLEHPPRILIRLRVGGYVTGYLESSPLSGDQTLCIDPDDENKSIVELSQPNDGVLLRRLLGWGANVEVLSPPELRHKVASQVAKMARLYGYTVPCPEKDLV